MVVVVFLYYPYDTRKQCSKDGELTYRTALSNCLTLGKKRLTSPLSFSPQIWLKPLSSCAPMSLRSILGILHGVICWTSRTLRHEFQTLIFLQICCSLISELGIKSFKTKVYQGVPTTRECPLTERIYFSIYL